MTLISKQTDWAQKYRPKKMEDMILPSKIKYRLLKIRDAQQGLSLLLHGNAGTGKTTAARLLMPDTTYELNCSLLRGTSMVGEINRGCSNVPIGGDIRLVLLDEADYLTKSAQAGLRNAIERLSASNMFVFTANYPEKLIAPLHSRLHAIDFNFGKDDQLIEQMLDRVMGILETEECATDVDQVRQVVTDCFPDMRSVLKKLQFEFGLMN